jgi:ABC-type multidrug transport system fused ATPase/permease subunit
MLGNMKKTGGKVVLSCDKIALQDQSPWIFNGTLRANVLFGLPYEEAWYETVVTACALRPDLDQLPDGDLSEIGERGVNVSGGQKARIGLARAVYSRADLVLLDDPLAAVDVHVARHIFDECICGVLATSAPRRAAAEESGAVGERDSAATTPTTPPTTSPTTTRVLVTHQLQFVDAADWIIILDGGRVKAQGTYAALLAAGMVEKSEGGAAPETPRAAAAVEEADADAETGNAPRSEAPLSDRPPAAAAAAGGRGEVQRPGVAKAAAAAAAGGALTSKEGRRAGAVRCSQLWQYSSAMGCPFAGLLPIVLFAATQLAMGGSDTWVAAWVKDEFNRPGANGGADEQWFYIAGYLGCALLVTLAIFVSSAVFQLMALRAATALHDRTFARLLRAKTSFFQTTPLGRILNRFAGDVDTMDTNLPDVLETLFSLASSVLLAIVIIAVVLPWFLVALVGLVAIYAAWTHVFRQAARQLKRLDSIAKSPIVSQLKVRVHHFFCLL